MYIRRPKKSKESGWDQDDDEENKNGRGEKILATQREGEGKGGLLVVIVGPHLDDDLMICSYGTMLKRKDGILMIT